MKVARTICAVSTLFFALAFIGCGYHTAGHVNPKFTNVKTIAIPAFVNQTQQYKIEQMLTSAVVREFVTRTRYRVVNQVEPDADATLQGYLTNIQIAPVTFDAKTGRASTVLVAIAVRVVLQDRSGKVLFENPNYVFREQYQVSRELSSFFEEQGPAMDRLSRRFAESLVSNVLEGY